MTLLGGPKVTTSPRPDATRRTPAFPGSDFGREGRESGNKQMLAAKRISATPTNNSLRRRGVVLGEQQSACGYEAWCEGIQKWHAATGGKGYANKTTHRHTYEPTQIRTREPVVVWPPVVC